MKTVLIILITLGLLCLAWSLVVGTVKLALWIGAGIAVVAIVRMLFAKSNTS